MRMYVREESLTGRSTLTDMLYPDLLRAVAMTRLMLAKWLEPLDETRMHLSTLTHQILSCLKQTGGMPAPNLYESLCGRGPFRNVSQPQFAALLRSLATHKGVEQVPQGELILGLMGERLTAGFDFYAAFQTSEEFLIRCGGEEIGKLPANIIPPVGEHLLLDGRRWHVKEILLDQKLVLVVFSPGGKAPSFQGAAGEIHTHVMREMKTVLLNTDEPLYLDQPGTLLLRAARRAARLVRLSETNIVIGRQRIQWFPWVGTRTLHTLSLLAKSNRIPHEQDRLSITYHLPSAKEFFEHLRQILSSDPDGVQLARLMPVKSVEKYDDFLPETLLDEANSRGRLAVPEALAACTDALR